MTQALQESIIKVNEKGNRACKNKYNVFLLDNNFVYFIILAAFGYLISLFLKSYSIVKLKSIINQNFISIDIIITFIGIFGLVLNIILIYFKPNSMWNWWLHQRFLQFNEIGCQKKYFILF